MFKLPIILMFLFSMSFSADTLITVTKHDTVFIDRLVIDNPEAVKRMTEPFVMRVSSAKKYCAYAMIAGGIGAGAFSIFNLAEGGKTYQSGSYSRKYFRSTGYYEINICLSVGLVAAGFSLLLK